MSEYTDFLKSWAENHASLSMGTIDADKLYDIALDAHRAGKDLNDPAVRKTLMRAAIK